MNLIVEFFLIIFFYKIQSKNGGVQLKNLKSLSGEKKLKKKLPNIVL
jgi:hypothetical protein